MQIQRLAYIAALLAGLGYATEDAIGDQIRVKVGALLQFAQEAGKQFHWGHAMQGSGILGSAARCAQSFNDHR